MPFVQPRTPRLGVLVAAICATVHSASSLRADVITFDDLGPSTGGVHMPSVYSGLRWGTSDWHYLSLASNPTNTYLALSGTATFVGSPLGGEDFYFAGADFWSRRGLDANGDFYFVLYHDGATVYNGREDPDGRQRFSGTRSTFSPTYSEPIDGVAIAFDNDDWDHLAMDNVQIQFVPSPGAAAVFIAGLVPVLRRQSRPRRHVGPG